MMIKINNKKDIMSYVQKIVKYTLLILLALWVLIPFYVLLVTSVKTSAEANHVSFTWFPKQGFDFSSYKIVLFDDTSGITILASLMNTLRVSFFPSFIAVLMSSLSAYAYAKLNFIAKDKLFMFLIATMMIPGCITLTTSFLIYDKLQWVDTFYPMIIPPLFGSIGIIFFMRQYFMSIPDALLEAAEMDGLGKLKAFFLIIMPLAVPAFLAQFILTFIGRYNDYLTSLIYLISPEKYTLQIALKFFAGSVLSGGNGMLASACIVSIVPMLLIYLFLQNYILSGISMKTGLKG